MPACADRSRDPAAPLREAAMTACAGDLSLEGRPRSNGRRPKGLVPPLLPHGSVEVRLSRLALSVAAGLAVRERSERRARLVELSEAYESERAVVTGLEREASGRVCGEVGVPRAEGLRRVTRDEVRLVRDRVETTFGVSRRRR